MAVIKNRQLNPAPEIEYGEINIPDDSDLGTGTFFTQMKPITDTKVVASIMFNPPKFQISVSINYHTLEIPVLIGDLPPIIGPLVMLHIWRLYSTKYFTFC